MARYTMVVKLYRVGHTPQVGRVDMVSSYYSRFGCLYGETLHADRGMGPIEEENMTNVGDHYNS